MRWVVAVAILAIVTGADSHCPPGWADDDWFLYEPKPCYQHILTHRVLLIIEVIFSGLILLRQLMLMRTTQPSLIPALCLYVLTLIASFMMYVITLAGDSKKYFQARYALQAIATELLMAAMTWRQLVFLEIVLAVKEMAMKVGMRKYRVIAFTFTIFCAILLFLLWTVPWSTTPATHENIVRGGNAVTCVQTLFVAVGLLYLSASTVKIMQTTLDLQTKRSTNTRSSVSEQNDRIKGRIDALSQNAKISAGTMSLGIILHAVMSYVRMYYYLMHVIHFMALFGQVGLLRFLAALEQHKRNFFPNRPSIGGGSNHQSTKKFNCCGRAEPGGSQKKNGTGSSRRTHTSHPSRSDIHAARQSQNSPMAPNHKSANSGQISRGPNAKKHHLTSSVGEVAVAVPQAGSGRVSQLEMTYQRMSLGNQSSVPDSGVSLIGDEGSSVGPPIDRIPTFDQSPPDDTRALNRDPSEGDDGTGVQPSDGGAEIQAGDGGSVQLADDAGALARDTLDLYDAPQEDLEPRGSDQLNGSMIDERLRATKARNGPSGTSIIFTSPDNEVHQPSHEPNVVRIHTPTASPHGTPRSSQIRDAHVGVNVGVGVMTGGRLSRNSQSPYSTLRGVDVRSPSQNRRVSEEVDEDKPGLTHQNSGSLVRSQHVSRVSSLEPPRPGPVDTHSPRLSPRDGSVSLTGAPFGGTPRTTPKSEVRHGSGVGTGLVKGHPLHSPSAHSSQKQQNNQDH